MKRLDYWISNDKQNENGYVKFNMRNTVVLEVSNRALIDNSKGDCLPLHLSDDDSSQTPDEKREKW